MEDQDSKPRSPKHSLLKRSATFSPNTAGSGIGMLIGTESSDDQQLGSPTKTPTGSPVDLTHLQATFKSPIVGDIFGSRRGSDALNGLMYRSRVLEGDKIQEDDDDHLNEDTENFDSVESYTETRESDDDSEDEYKHFKSMNPKQQLALTIKNWSLSSENDHYIIEEGGVQALIALCHVEDAFIRRCCASSFFHLSSRGTNRQALLSSGGTNGIALCLQGSPPRCHWKVARLCALSLCNLSMEQDGEATMANENAAVVCVQLSTYQGTSLLPICIQALYNLTCARQHFKGIERIIKAFLNFSSSTFDYSVFLVRALVNCSRYSWLRLRIIEDGALSCLNALLTGLPANEHRMSLTYDMLTALRSLSDSAGCRADMLSKGAVDMLNNLLPYSDDQGRRQIMKILHNFLQAPASAMNNSSFETAVLIATLIVSETGDHIIIQYCSACFHIITKEHIRGMRHLALNIIDSMAVLLRCPDPLTQFFAISSSGNLFFNNLCDNQAKVEQLVLNFVEHGPGINDPAANQALALALAKLSQEPSYMAVIVKLRLLHDVLELLLKLLDLHQDSLLLQESCCIAICRIALKIEAMDHEEKERIAEVFVNMLGTDDQYVLQSTVSGIRALGSSGLCPKELLSDTLLNRIAAIVDKYSDVTELCRTGCAVLAVFSYDIEAHDLLAAENIMKVLFANIKAEDGITRELVATSLCNVSVNTLASNMMIQMGVVDVLANLSSSTSENILELCAKCICNLTCNVNLHPRMMENKVLEIILMISLVRTVLPSTKLICAKALLNLVTDLNLDYIERSGAVRVFATLSTIDHGPIQQICSKGFYLLTLNTERRQVTVSSRKVMQSLYNMVKSSSSRTRVRIGTAVCNLLSCPTTNKAAIYAGALSVLKIIATMDFEELRESCARVIINLSEDDSLKDLLLQQPLVEILVLVLHNSRGYTFECAILALSRLSQSEVFKDIVIERGGVTALISTVMAGKIRSPVMAEEVCRCLCHLSYRHQYAERMISSGHLIMSLHAVYLTGMCSADTALLIAITLRNFSESLAARKYIMAQDAFKLVVSLITDFTTSRYCCTIIYSSLVTFVYNLSLVPALHTSLVSQGLMQLLKKICLFANDEDADTDEAMRTDTVTGAPSTVTNPTTATAATTDNATCTEETKGQQGDEPTTSGASATAGQGGNGEHGSAAPRRSRAAGATLLYRKQRRAGFFYIEQAADEFYEAILNFTPAEIHNIAKTINLLSQTASCHKALVDGGVMKIFKALIGGLSKDVSARTEVATALANLSASKLCRVQLVQQNSAELLIALSQKADVNTQSQCALALGYLSELTKINDGIVSSLLTLSISLEESNAVPGQVSTDAATSSLIHGRRVGAGADATGGGGGGGTAMQADAQALLSQLQAQNASASGAGGAGAAGAGTGANLQTLSSLLKGVLLDKTKYDQYIAALEENNKKNMDANRFVAPAAGAAGAAGIGTVSSASSVGSDPLNGSQFRTATKLNVDASHAGQIAEEEANVLRCHYDRYKLDRAESHDCYESESGGMSMKLLMELPLPGIPANRDLDPLDRHAELTKMKISQEPLPKDKTTPHPMETRPNTVAEQAAAAAAAAEKEAAEQEQERRLQQQGLSSNASSRPVTPGMDGSPVVGAPGGAGRRTLLAGSSKSHGTGRDTLQLRRRSNHPGKGDQATLPVLSGNAASPGAMQRKQQGQGQSQQQGTRPSILRKSSTHQGNFMTMSGPPPSIK